MAEFDPVQYEPYGTIVIGTVKGVTSLDAITAEDFGESVVDHVAANPGIHLLLNLHHVRYVSSAGISEIIRIHNEAEEHGGGLRITGVSEDVQKVFEVTNLIDFFHVEPDVQAAAEAYVRRLAERD